MILKENYGFSEDDFYRKLNNFVKKRYEKNINYNNQRSLGYYLGNLNNDAGFRLNNFIINNLDYKTKKN